MQLGNNALGWKQASVSTFCEVDYRLGLPVREVFAVQRQQTCLRICMLCNIHCLALPARLPQTVASGDALYVQKHNDSIQAMLSLLMCSAITRHLHTVPCKSTQSVFASRSHLQKCHQRLASFSRHAWTCRRNHSSEVSKKLSRRPTIRSHTFEHTPVRPNRPKQQ